MTADLDLATLRLLLCISQTGSVSAAAAELGISQPAASARIREFEARWRLATVRRSPRGSRLTPDGEAVVNWARAVLEAADMMRTALGALGEHRKTTVLVAASLTIAEYLMPRWLGELHTQLPRVRPVLQVVNSQAVVAVVRAGQADLGFIETSDIPSGLASRAVGQDPLAIVVAPTHPWARRRTPLTVQEMRTSHWVLREAGSGTRSTFTAALGCEPQVAMESTSITPLIGAAVAGLGPAVLSERSVRTEVETGALRAVPSELALNRPLTALWRKEERLNEVAGALLAIAVGSGTTLSVARGPATPV